VLFAGECEETRQIQPIMKKAAWKGSQFCKVVHAGSPQVLYREQHFLDVALSTTRNQLLQQSYLNFWFLLRWRDNMNPNGRNGF